MKKLIIVVVILGLVPLVSLAQRQVLYEVMPTKERNVLAQRDTLWVLKRKDVMQLYSTAEKYEAFDSQLSTLRYRVNTLEKEGKVKDNTINQQEKKITEIEASKKATEEYLRTLTIKAERQKKELNKERLFRNISLIGVGLAFIVGILI